MLLSFFDTIFYIGFWWVVASISAPCWKISLIIFMFVRDRFCYVFSNSIFIKFWPNIAVKHKYGAAWASLFLTFFRALLPFTLVRPNYKCQKQIFLTFVKKQKEFLHTCSFYLGQTYKCAVTVFTILTKNNEKNLDFERSKAWFWSIVCSFWQLSIKP